nr:MAG TPA: hypothetical protein [Caudoviricetes sp.]
MKKQYLTQVIIGEHKTTAIPIWSGYGHIHTLPTTSIQTRSYQRISTSRDLCLNAELKQYINKITGAPQVVRK